MALDARPDGHGHFQAERCAAGDALLLQAQHPVHAAGGKGQKQHGIQRKPLVKYVRHALNQLPVPQQCREQHGEELNEHHQLQPALRKRPEGVGRRQSGGQKRSEQAQQQGDLALAHPLLGKRIIPFFRSGDDFPFQVRQPGTGPEGNGLGRDILPHRLLIFRLPVLGEGFLRFFRGFFRLRRGLLPGFSLGFLFDFLPQILHMLQPHGVPGNGCFRL